MAFHLSQRSCHKSAMRLLYIAITGIREIHNTGGISRLLYKTNLWNETPDAAGSVITPQEPNILKHYNSAGQHKLARYRWPWRPRAAVSANEFGDPQRKSVKLRVNGVEKQNGTTADMIFPIDETIHVLSRGCTLEAGDIISTGTPEGVGMGRTPQEWLKVGDQMETEVEGIGVLRNKVVAA